jgi:hypothetical protein
MPVRPALHRSPANAPRRTLSNGLNMQTKTFTTVLALAVFALPAAVPASQPADVKMTDLTPAITVTPQAARFAMLLADPSSAALAELTIELPQKFTTFEWINQHPFAL